MRLQAGAGAEPDAALGVLVDRRDGLVQQAVSSGIAPRLLAVHAQQAGGGGHPQRSMGGGGDDERRVGDHDRGAWLRRLLAFDTQQPDRRTDVEAARGLVQAAPHLKAGMTPNDLAEILLFLADDSGRMLSGTNLEIFSNA